MQHQRPALSIRVPGIYRHEIRRGYEKDGQRPHDPKLVETNRPLPDTVAGCRRQRKNLVGHEGGLFFTVSLLLKDKVIFLTGGSCGIGRDCAKAYAAEGALVVIAANDREGIEEIGAELGR